MSQKIADEFIEELATTIRNFESKRDAAPGFGSLLDVSSHMIDALDVLKSKLPARNTAPPAI